MTPAREPGASYTVDFGMENAVLSDDNRLFLAYLLDYQMVNSVRPRDRRLHCSCNIDHSHAAFI